MRHQLRNGAILSYIQTALNILVVIAFTPLLTHSLGQQEYGLYALVMAYGGYLSLLDMGLSNVIIRYISRNRIIGDEKKEAELNGFFLTLYAGIMLFSLFIGYGLYSHISNAFVHTLSPVDIERAKLMTIILVLNFSVSFPLSIGASLMQAYEYFTQYQIFLIGKIIAAPLISIPMLYLGHQSVMLIIVSSICNLVYLAGCFVFIRIKGHMRVSFEKVEWWEKKEILVYAFFIFLEMLMGCVYWKTGQIILGLYSSVKAVATYSIAIQFVTLMMALSTGISSVLLPRVTMMVAKGVSFSELTNLMVRVGRAQSFILGAFVVCYVAFGDYFVHLWVGGDYTEVYFIGLVFIATLFIPLIQNSGISILLALNRNKFRMAIYTVFAFISVLISIPLVKQYDALGCAFANAITLSLSASVIINFYYAHIGLEIFRFFKRVSRIICYIIVSALFWYSITHYLYCPSDIVSFLFMSFACFCGYILWGSKLLTSEEKMYLKGIVSKR